MAPYSTKEGDAPRSGRRRPAGWVLGLPALALLWVASTLWLAPRLEHDIRRATIELGARPDSAFARHRARPEIDGRDVRIVADLGLPDGVRAGTEEAMRRIRGVRSVRTDVATPVRMTPYALGIRRTETGLALTGGIPDAEARVALLDQAGRIVPADAVDDRLQLVTDAPPDVAAAGGALLRAVGHAVTGEAALSGQAFRLRAVAPDSAAYAAILAAVGSVPATFRPDGVEVLPPSVSPFGWTASRSGDELGLTGNVPSEADRQELAARAAAAMPGLRLRDEMRTARGLEAGVDFAALASAAFAGLAAVQSGRAELVGRRFAFTGESVAKARLAAIERQVRSSLPGRVEVGDIVVRAVSASPFRFTARRADGRLVLSGFVPDDDGRRVAAAVASARYPGEALVDGRVSADGAPPGFADAERIALETLSNFADGEAIVRDRELRVTGRVLYGQLAARLRENGPRLAPAGWTSQVVPDPVIPERALDPVLCADLLADASRRQPIRFEPGKAEPAAASRGAVEAAADLVRRCGSVPIRVVHRVPEGADREAARSLALRRAAALVAALDPGGGKLKADGGVAVAGEPADRTELVVELPGKAPT